MADSEARGAMNSIIRDVVETGRSNLHSTDSHAYAFDTSNGQQPIALQRVVDAMGGDVDLKVAKLESDKYVLQRSYGVTSFIYLANGKQ